MSPLMQASREWASRPADERFTSLVEMGAHFDRIRDASRNRVQSSRRLTAIGEGREDLLLQTESGELFAPTNWAFGQLAQRAEAPAGYLRTLPAAIAADAINYGLKFKRAIEDVGVLTYQNGSNTVRAITGPNYGRIWNGEIVEHLLARFGDGVTGAFKVPGEFGRPVEITKANTTLFAGDRDMFVFLADEEHRIANPARDGAPMARGFFVWNSEVGSATFGLATFLFDYVCCNRMVWGPAEYREIRLRHTSSAPDKFLEELAPALVSYANSSSASITHALEAAKAARIDGSDGALDDFLAKRFGKRLAPVLKATHEAEEGRPIESLWDAATAVTAHAKTITWQDERVELERAGGALLDLALA